jgi:hypothetical protein
MIERQKDTMTFTCPDNKPLSGHELPPFRTRNPAAEQVIGIYTEPRTEKGFQRHEQAGHRDDSLATTMHAKSADRLLRMVQESGVLTEGRSQPQGVTGC